VQRRVFAFEPKRRPYSVNENFPTAFHTEESYKTLTKILVVLQHTKALQVLFPRATTMAFDVKTQKKFQLVYICGFSYKKGNQHTSAVWQTHKKAVRLWFEGCSKCVGEA
jgi:hypothetical protein